MSKSVAHRSNRKFEIISDIERMLAQMIAPKATKFGHVSKNPVYLLVIRGYSFLYSRQCKLQIAMRGLTYVQMQMVNLPHNIAMHLIGILVVCLESVCNQQEVSTTHQCVYFWYLFFWQQEVTINEHRVSRIARTGSRRSLVTLREFWLQRSLRKQQSF